MTRKQFLKKLGKQLAGLKRRELSRYLADYDEMISDLMEHGLTEEDAVGHLGGVEKIAGEIMEEAPQEARSHLDLPGMVLAVISLLLLIFSFYELMTFGVFFRESAPWPWVGESVSIIGGADGPTSIFLAGKVSWPVGLYVVTGCCVIVTVLYLFRKYRKKK